MNEPTTGEALRHLGELAEQDHNRLKAAIDEAYTILCSGNPPCSAREANARNVLRQAGAKINR